MKPNMLIFCVLLVGFDIVAAHFGYYWRDYHGVIPSDAISTSNDPLVPSYIGQAYIHGDGTSVVEIFPGIEEVYAASYGYKKAPNVVKILCVKNIDQFTWFTTNATTFHVDMITKHPVVGGYDHREQRKGMLHVGRVKHRLYYRVGSIEGFLENAWINYVSGNSAHRKENYEVLLYKDPDLYIYNDATIHDL